MLQSRPRNPSKVPIQFQIRFPTLRFHLLAPSWPQLAAILAPSSPQLRHLGFNFARNPFPDPGHTFKIAISPYAFSSRLLIFAFEPPFSLSSALLCPILLPSWPQLAAIKVQLRPQVFFGFFFPFSSFGFAWLPWPSTPPRVEPDTFRPQRQTPKDLHITKADSTFRTQRQTPKEGGGGQPWLLDPPPSSEGNVRDGILRSSLLPNS